MRRSTISDLSLGKSQYNSNMCLSAVEEADIAPSLVASAFKHYVVSRTPGPGDHLEDRPSTAYFGSHLLNQKTRRCCHTENTGQDTNHGTARSLAR